MEFIIQITLPNRLLKSARNSGSCFSEIDDGRFFSLPGNTTQNHVIGGQQIRGAIQQAHFKGLLDSVHHRC